MDKMVIYQPPAVHPASERVFFKIQTSKGEVIVTNDGATILRSIQALHPAAKMVRLARVDANLIGSY
jgi:phosphatidylserine decarboxylase